jgi:hypothetical protein
MAAESRQYPVALFKPPRRLNVVHLNPRKEKVAGSKTDDLDFVTPNDLAVEVGGGAKEFHPAPIRPRGHETGFICKKTTLLVC